MMRRSSKGVVLGSALACAGAVRSKVSMEGASAVQAVDTMASLLNLQHEEVRRIAEAVDGQATPGASGHYTTALKAVLDNVKGELMPKVESAQREAQININEALTSVQEVERAAVSAKGSADKQDQAWFACVSAELQKKKFHETVQEQLGEAQNDEKEADAQKEKNRKLTWKAGDQYQMSMQCDNDVEGACRSKKAAMMASIKRMMMDAKNQMGSKTRYFQDLEAQLKNKQAETAAVTMKVKNAVGDHQSHRNKCEAAKQRRDRAVCEYGDVVQAKGIEENDFNTVIEDVDGGEAKCMPKSTFNGAKDDGYGDAFRGWYDIQGCGRCLDYCRWVGNGGSGGDPALRTTHGEAWWSCRLAGGAESHTGKGGYEVWSFQKCDGEGATSSSKGGSEKSESDRKNEWKTLSHMACMLEKGIAKGLDGPIDANDHGACADQPDLAPLARKAGEFDQLSKSHSAVARPISFGNGEEWTVSSNGDKAEDYSRQTFSVTLDPDAGEQPFDMCPEENAGSWKNLEAEKLTAASSVPKHFRNVLEQWPGPEEIEVAAGAGTVAAPFIYVTDSGYVELPEGEGNRIYDDTNGGQASVGFSLRCSQTTTVKFAAWLLAPDGGSDSFYIQVKDGAKETWHTGGGPTWKWSRDSPALSISEGSSSVTLWGREDGIKFKSLNLVAGYESCRWSQAGAV